MEQVKTPISILKENLLKCGFLLEHNDAFEKNLQQLMNQGVVQIKRLSKEECMVVVDINGKIIKHMVTPC